MKNKRMPNSPTNVLSNKISPIKSVEVHLNSQKIQENTMKYTFSPQTPSKNSQNMLLRKKRKNSDLNIDNESSAVKSKLSGRATTPFTSETKITSYFNQMKSSSYKKGFNNSESGKSTEKLSYKYQARSCNFAKRLNFDEVTQNADMNLINNYNNTYLNNSELNISKNFPTNFLNINNSAFLDSDELEEEGEGQKQPPAPKFTENTLKLLNSLKNRIIKTPNKILNSNLNLDKLIKKTNYMINSPYKSNINKVIQSHSMKEKYEGLISRELILPCHFKTLMNKFVKLNQAISNCKAKKIISSLSNIKMYFTNTQDCFTIDEFQQILFISPHFFIYKWDKINNTREYDLLIDIPIDIQRRLDEAYDERTNFTQLQTYPYSPFKAELTKDIIDKRINIFKKVLLHLTADLHRQFLKDKNIVTKLNPFKHRTWHSEFDIHKVPAIEKFRIVEKPRS